ncbi:MAG: PKD domain-containing protein [Bacteroidia bacterium]|nr:PKD domain-containing protein [Bacteroidia bacterium]
MKKRIKVFLLFLLFGNFSLRATHIVGGELIYDYLGSNQYRITLKVFRDCKPGATGFDGIAGGTSCYVFIFRANGTLHSSVYMGLPVVNQVPPTINNPCILPPGGICVEEGIYTATVTLPPVAGGYYLVYQRCCRNNTINNIVMPQDAGATFMNRIPGPEVAAVNNSPRFSQYPPIFVCNGQDLNFFQSATDPDGDVLKYSLCAAFNGLDPCCPLANTQTYSPSSSPGCMNPPPACPSMVPAPPYPLLTYNTPYSGTYPIASNPSIQINPNTGLLSGKPTQNGQYVLKICVEEYRNNQLINTHYREIQVNVVQCQFVAVGAFADQPNKCMGDTIPFKNNSIGGNTYFWDFGVPSLTNDTSRLTNPTYIYPDTGMYMVTLIVNPGTPCSDTLKKPVYVYPKLKVKPLLKTPQCIKNNVASFTVQGAYYPGVTQFTWNVPNAIPPLLSGTSAVSPTTSFQSAGVHTVHLYVKHFVCRDTLKDTLRVLKRPKAEIKNFPDILCAPRVVSLINGSETEYPASYQWFVNNEVPLSGIQPTFAMLQGGQYTVQLVLIRYGVCPDTSTDIKIFSAYPLPNPGFKPQPDSASIFEPDFYFVSTTPDNNITHWYYDFGDGMTSSGFKNTSHSYQEPGTYSVTQTVTNSFGCSASLTKTVLVWPEFRFWIPNAFSPDQNGLNDIFKPFVIGVENYKFYVFNRWGEIVYKTQNRQEGWDGTFRGKKCKSDVYAWLIEFKNIISGKPEVRTGHVMLLNGE